MPVPAKPGAGFEDVWFISDRREVSVVVNVNLRYTADIDDATADRIAAALDARARRRGGRPRFGDR